MEQLPHTHITLVYKSKADRAWDTVNWLPQVHDVNDER